MGTQRGGERIFLFTPFLLMIRKEVKGGIFIFKYFTKGG